MNGRHEPEGGEEETRGVNGADDRNDRLPMLAVLVVLPLLQAFAGDVVPWVSCAAHYAMHEEPCSRTGRIDAELYGILVATLAALALLFVGTVRKTLSTRVLISGIVVALLGGVFAVLKASVDDNLGFPLGEPVRVGLYVAVALGCLFALPAVLARRAPRRLMHVGLAAVATIAVSLLVGLLVQGALETLWWALADAKRTSRKYLLAPSALVAAAATWAVLARHLTLFPGLDPVEPDRRRWQGAFALAGIALIALYVALYFADEHRAFVKAAAGGPILWHGTLLATLVWPTLWSTCALIEAGSVRARPLSIAMHLAAIGAVGGAAYASAIELLGAFNIDRIGDVTRRFNETDALVFVVAHVATACAALPAARLGRSASERLGKKVLGGSAIERRSSG